MLHCSFFILPAYINQIVRTGDKADFFWAALQVYGQNYLAATTSLYRDTPRFQKIKLS